MASVAPSPQQEARRGGAWTLLEEAACFIAFAEKDGAAAAARDANSKSDALSPRTDALGYGTVAGRISRDGVTTSNFLFMAVLQHGPVDDDGVMTCCG